MQHEEQVRGVPSEGPLADVGVTRPSADPQGIVGGVGGTAAVAPLRVVLDDDVRREPAPRAETVPSDQLWRAAIRAAREAAALAADLRRQLTNGGAGADDGPRAVA
jgi:hypothetical protein